MVGLFNCIKINNIMKRNAELIATAKPGKRLVKCNKDFYIHTPEVVRYPTNQLNLAINEEKVWNKIVNIYNQIKNKTQNVSNKG